MNLFKDGDMPTVPEWFYIGKNTPATHVANIRAGKHPMGLSLLRPNSGETCGNCAHMGRHGRFLKCTKAPRTRGPATDVRAKWHACIEWETA